MTTVQVGTRRSTPAATAVEGALAADPVADAADELRSALQAHLDGRWVGVRDQVRAIAREPLFAPVHDLPRAVYREQVMRQTRAIAATGLPLLGMPASVGGHDDPGASVTAFEMLAYGDLSLLVKAGVQWGLFGGAVHHLGTRIHHERYLADIASFDLPGCFAMTETGHGSDVAEIRTRATYDPAHGEFVIHTPDRSAYKDYIGNAARDGRAAVVFAQLSTPGVGPNGPDTWPGARTGPDEVPAATRDHGVHAFLVPIRDADGRPCPGVTIEDCGAKAGLNGVDNGRLAFDSVRVPRDALLNRYGDVAADGTYSTSIANPNARFFTMLGTLIQGRISVAGGAGSAAKAALTIAVRYGEQRRQFRAPGGTEEVRLLDYRSHQRRLLPKLATSYALHFAQADLVVSLRDVFSGPETDSAGPRSAAARRQLETRAAGIKAVGTWHATATIQEAREACGGAGYLAENRLPALKADIDVFTTFEGDNTVLMQLVAKELLTRYRTAFGELDTLGTVRFVADQFARAVAERTATRGLVNRLVSAAPGRDEDADLFDRGHHSELFRWRERHMIDEVARRLRRVKPDGPDAFARVNDTQDQLLGAARAHVDRLVLESFVAGIAGCADPAARELLDQVCDLYALSVIEGDRAWFLEHGRLSPRRSRAVTRAVNAACARLRPHARLLVDAFGIPEAALAAPLIEPADAR